jgi:hypothetical protein
MLNVIVRNYNKLRARRVERTRPTALPYELILPASKEQVINPIFITFYGAAWLSLMVQHGLVNGAAWLSW